MCIKVPGLEFLGEVVPGAVKKKPPIEFTEGGIEFTEGGIELRGVGIEFSGY